MLADSEREAVADLLNFLENVGQDYPHAAGNSILTSAKRQETDFFTGEPLQALSTLVYSHNIDLQRSASLTFAEITERGAMISALYKEDQLAEMYRCSTRG